MNLSDCVSELDCSEHHVQTYNTAQCLSLIVTFSVRGSFSLPTEMLGNELEGHLYEWNRFSHRFFLGIKVENWLFRINIFATVSR